MPSGPFSMYWNPAGICESDNVEVASFINNWIATINHGFSGITVPFSKNNYLGIGVTYMTMDDMEETTIIQPQGTGRFFSAMDYVAAIAYGHRISDRFASAISVKYINERIMDIVSDGWAMDVGFTYFYNNLHLGMSFSNFGLNKDISGTQLQFEYQIYPEENTDDVLLGFIPKELVLPMSFRFGAGYNIVKVDNHKLAIMSSLYYSNDIGQSENIGLEYIFKENYCLRGGYQINHYGFDWSLGGGIKFYIKDLLFDFGYATVNLQDFGLRYQSSLAFSF